MKSHRTLLKSEWLGEVVALVIGALLPLAFAPFHFYPLAFMVPAVLVWLWFDVSQRRAVLRGYLFGIGFFGVGVTWVAVSMVRFGGIAMPLASLLTGLFVLIWAIFPALVAYVVHRWFRASQAWLSVVWVIPGLWTLSEWVRGWLFSGFPWLSLGYSQVNGPLSGFAPIIGVYGVSWLVMCCSGLLLLVIASQSMRRRLQCAIGLVFVLGLSFALGQIPWTDPIGHSLKASLIQGNIAQDLKWLPEQRQPSIDLYTRLTQEHWDSDIIIWPETALPAFFHQAKSYLTHLAEEAKQHESEVLIGMPVLDQADAEQGRRYYNSFVLLGDEFTFYHKQHLVPFGEFVPLKSILGGFFDFFHIPMADFSSGEREAKTLPVAGLQAGISICYEDAFGEEVIEALPQANFLINVSNDAWFGDSLAPHQHLQMAQMRSLETGRPMLRGTNNGVSAVIDAHGEVIATSPQFQQHVLTASIQPMQGSTPYVIVGNAAMLVMCLLSLSLPLVIARQRAR